MTLIFLPFSRSWSSTAAMTATATSQQSRSFITSSNLIDTLGKRIGNKKKSDQSWKVWKKNKYNIWFEISIACCVHWISFYFLSGVLSKKATKKYLFVGSPLTPVELVAFLLRFLDSLNLVKVYRDSETTSAPYCMLCTLNNKQAFLYSGFWKGLRK